MSRLSRRALIGSALAMPALRAAHAQASVLRIGAPLPLTGALAPEGLKQRHGYEIWADAVNQDGGITVAGAKMKVELLFADYESNSARAVQATEQMITQSKVSAMLGPYGSGAVKAASTVTERYKVPMLGPNASAREIYDGNHKFLFGTLVANDQITAVMAKYIHDTVPQVKRVAVLARNDLFPLALAGLMEVAAKEAGIEVVSSEHYAIGTLDHASALTQMAAAQPGWVFVTGYINDLILVRKQMAELNFVAPVVTMITGPSNKEFVDALGPLADGITSASWWEPNVPYTGQPPFATAPEYAARFAAKYGNTPDYSEASSTACCLAIQYAAEKAGSIDPVAIRDALASLDVMTFFGRLKFGPSGQVVASAVPMFQIQDGKRVILAPADIRQGAMKVLA